MAAATITVTVQHTWMEGPMLHVLGTLTFSASPDTYTALGNVLNLNDSRIKAQRTPQWVSIQGQSGFVYKYIPGSNNTNGKVRILTGAAAQSELTELTAGAVPAGVSGDTIKFQAMFLGQN